MLKIIFWILLLGNGALFAYQQGYLNTWFAPSNEPARMSRQLNADKIKLLPAPGKTLPAGNNEPVAPEPAAASRDAAVVAASLPAGVARKAEADSKPEVKPEIKPEVVACLEIGTFNEQDAARFEAQLARLGLGKRSSKRVVQENTSHMVFIPSQGNKENADKKVDQLRQLGISDFYVIQENSDLRWGISLGIFSNETGAKTRLAQLNDQGVKTARIIARHASKVAFQLKGMDGAGKDQLAKLKGDFPQQQMRSCV